jgi:hypothetical protein
MNGPLPFPADVEDEVELVVADLGVARAFWAGVPAARLLARVRVNRDGADLVGGSRQDSTWDALVMRLLARAPASLERVKRAVARHTRAASDEGPLPSGSGVLAGDAEIAALVHALLSASDADASAAEGAAEGVAIDEPVREACAELDARLGAERGDRRPAAFEACVRLAALGAAQPAKLGATLEALDILAGGAARALVASASPLYPWGDDEVRVGDRRACLLERADLERVVLGPENATRAVAARVPASSRRIAQDVSQLLTRRGALLVFVTFVTAPGADAELADAKPLPPSSWLPSDFGSHDAAQRLAAALERGATTIPRARAVVARGGDPALDAIGKEMLDVGAHPFSSAVFAEILAKAGRERDVVRLVGYFAIAPDPSSAAQALAMCEAPDVPTVLRAWLESMLPTDGGAAAAGEDPAAPGSRLASCAAALRPFPHLYAAVRPLLARVSDPPPSR